MGDTNVKYGLWRGTVSVSLYSGMSGHIVSLSAHVFNRIGLPSASVLRHTRVQQLCFWQDAF